MFALSMRGVMNQGITSAPGKPGNKRDLHWQAARDMRQPGLWEPCIEAAIGAHLEALALSGLERWCDSRLSGRPTGQSSKAHACTVVVNRSRTRLK